MMKIISWEKSSNVAEEEKVLETLESEFKSDYERI
jgi:hypothetical protein